MKTIFLTINFLTCTQYGCLIILSLENQDYFFARDCHDGSAILKLNTMEDLLVSKYFKLYEKLKELQRKKVVR